MEIRFSVQDNLQDNQAKAVVSKLVYSIEDVAQCDYDSSAKEIVVFLSEKASKTEVLGLIEDLVQEEKHSLNIQQRIVKESNQLGFELHELEAIVFSPTIKKEEVVKLYSALDVFFIGLAEKYEAQLREYQSMIPFNVLDKCKYISYFPQNIYMVSEFPHQMAVLDRVKETQMSDYGDLSRLSGYALAPAVCFHCYEELYGQTIDEPVILTAKGKCFRHEAPWRIGNYRLNEFSMREIVFAGNPNFVENIRNQILEDVWTIFNNLGMPGHVETANDPFYFQEDKMKGQHQIMANMKYELIFQNDGAGESFAIASFNNVKDTLSKQFKITDSNKTAVHSGCVAFGIDRWAYALFSMYGNNVETWPTHIKRVLQLNKEDDVKAWAIR